MNNTEQNREEKDDATDFVKETLVNVFLKEFGEEK